ncbi:LOW QUALITY PROTEIN: hypothetical protein HZS_1523 [Henneguya salminicola]|nr:LOW QUALITY PROTEIN: hypothetical protein HZS_1523 [Henneguya salminicola]
MLSEDQKYDDIMIPQLPLEPETNIDVESLISSTRLINTRDPDIFRKQYYQDRKQFLKNLKMFFFMMKILFYFKKNPYFS